LAHLDDRDDVLERARLADDFARQKFDEIRTTVHAVRLLADDTTRRAGAHPPAISDTHRGELEGIRPTGKRITGTGLTMYRFSGNRVREALRRLSLPSVWRLPKEDL